MFEKGYKVYEPVNKRTRVEEIVTINIKATKKEIFKLACPVEELKWIPDWQYDLIYSKSGVNEINCIFKEKISGPHFLEQEILSTWVTADFDMESGRIIFIIDISGKASIRVNFTCFERNEISECTWVLTFTALDKETCKIPEDTLSEKAKLLIVFLSDLLKYYCETGEMMKP